MLNTPRVRAFATLAEDLTMDSSQPFVTPDGEDPHPPSGLLKHVA